MRKYSITYFIGQSIKGLWRNGIMSMASITVLMSCLAVMGSFSLLVININYNLEEIGVLNEIVVFVETERTELEVVDIYNQIRSLDNVNTVTHITKEEVKEEERLRFEKYPAVFKLIDDGGKNPYPDTFIVTYNDNSKVNTLQFNLNNIKGVENVRCNKDLAKSIDEVKNGIIVIFIWFLVILFVVSLFVIINTIKLGVFSRRQEISIMRYVGATNWFIVLPFILEGIIIGIVASGFAYLIQWYSYLYIFNTISKDFQIINLITFEDVRIFVALGFLAIGVVTGIIGSSLSLSKYLKA